MTASYPHAVERSEVQGAGGTKAVARGRRPEGLTAWTLPVRTEPRPPVPPTRPAAHRWPGAGRSAPGGGLPAGLGGQGHRPSVKSFALEDEPQAAGRMARPSCTYKVVGEPCAAGSSAQNGSALKREFSGGSYSAKRQPMPSPSEGSLSSGGMDQGSDAPARDYDGEVSAVGVAALSGNGGLEKACTTKGSCTYQSRTTTLNLASVATGICLRGRPTGRWGWTLRFSWRCSDF